ncbi:MAG: helix-turn-helix domain-containing protein [Lachnospiraceae bacterium]
MNQEKISYFIQQTRKEHGMTQKELADKLGISDKTVSKWETGKGMPDMDFLVPLCSALDINVNELLSGEKLSLTNYSEKAEENMMNLLKENEEHKKGTLLQNVLGILLALLALGSMMVMPGNTSITWFLDAYTLIELVLICGACVLLSGARTKQGIVEVIRMSVIPAGVLISMVGVVLALGSLSDVSKLGPTICVIALSVIYALLIYLILIPVSKRMK